MTEQDRMMYAKEYIHKLASGINPLDNSVLPDTDIVNNVHIARCLFYVSELIDGIIKKKNVYKSPFRITDEEIIKYEFSDRPISVSEIARRINRTTENDQMKKLTYSNIVSWLVSIGALETKTNESGKSRKRPTELGGDLGITVEHRFGRENIPYTAVVYNRNAQQFIVDNIQAIITHMES